MWHVRASKAGPLGKLYCRYTDILQGLIAAHSVMASSPGRRGVVNLSFSGVYTSYFDDALDDIHETLEDLGLNPEQVRVAKLGPNLLLEARMIRI